nr:hypothetical protein CFP56_72670 [Quercus suber]
MNPDYGKRDFSAFLRLGVIHEHNAILHCIVWLEPHRLSTGSRRLVQMVAHQSIYHLPLLSRRIIQRLPFECYGPEYDSRDGHPTDHHRAVFGVSSSLVCVYSKTISGTGHAGLTTDESSPDIPCRRAGLRGTLVARCRPRRGPSSDVDLRTKSHNEMTWRICT